MGFWGFEIKQKNVNAIAEKLYGEIRNPRNCGEGPAAESIIQDLKRELPGFQALSKASNNIMCDKNEIDGVIDFYQKSIATELQKTEECLNIKCTETNKLLDDVKSISETNLTEIDSISENLSSSRSTLRELRPRVEKVSSTYQSTVDRINSISSDRNTNILIPKEIDIKSVMYLGEWSKFPQLFWARIFDFSTWLYVLLAITFDVLMIHFFTRTRLAKNELINAKSSR